MYFRLGFEIRLPASVEEEDDIKVLPRLKVHPFEVGRYETPQGITTFATAVVNGVANVPNPAIVEHGRLKAGYHFNRNTKVLTL